MCFSETSSYINFFLLAGYGSMIYKTWRLSIPLWYLGLKDLLQGLLYKYIDNPKVSNILGILSYVHICFQPFIFNMAFSYFDTKKSQNTYWIFIFFITFIWGLWKLTKHETFDIQNDENCSDISSDFCASKNGGYIGKYHIGYKAVTEPTKFNLYIFFLFLPSLFTPAISIAFVLLTIVFILKVFMDSKGVRDGEFAAIWCFISVIYLLPIAIFRKRLYQYFVKK
tara:strand:+ start:793 stop:1467 length:675 start_codon:yes stop_codon:yes gene_type:complete